jgi:hypothetical protein
MAAFNPGGAEPVPGTPAAARSRDEGYLFWVAWVGHLTNSIFSTSDSQGPFRRVLLGFTCDTLRAQVNAIDFGPLGSTLANTLLGLPDLVAPTGVCSSTKPPLPTLQLPLPARSANKAGAAPAGGYNNPNGTTTTDQTPPPTTPNTGPQLNLPTPPTPPTPPNVPDIPNLHLPKLKLGLR